MHPHLFFSSLMHSSKNENFCTIKLDSLGFLFLTLQYLFLQHNMEEIGFELSQLAQSLSPHNSASQIITLHPFHQYLVSVYTHASLFPCGRGAG
jgi:hypothetical protein